MMNTMIYYWQALVPKPQTQFQGTGGVTIMQWSTTHPKSLGMIPYDHPANHIDQVDREIKDMDIIKKKVIKNP